VARLRIHRAYVAFPPEECARLLRDAVERDGVSSFDPPVTGHVVEASFQLRKRLPRSSHNSFQTYLTGKMTGKNGTRLSCRAGPHTFVMGFMAIWFLILMAMAVP